MAHSPREADIRQAYEQIQELSRRINDRSRRLGEPLSFVEHSLLRFIANTPGARATDIASAFSLNRSTVSRQLAGLVSMGLVTELGHDAGAPGRGRVLALTGEGEAKLAQAAAAQQESLRGRLSSWSDAQVHDFATALARYNHPE
ncbi:MarR family winged helix-turn-helix transcriptional regulator [Arthrobacter sp. JSM 101049]|uniref:MarR family winged helix-turn-helix transcriptional regulator n=1 Tax=Arthrobacter sp. JSM 101049 TaxID=929097 RepID=UPI003561D504